MTNSIPFELENLIRDYERYLDNTAGQAWDYASLEAEVFKYFDQWGENHPQEIDNLFTRFARIWALYYQSRKFQDADEFWKRPLDYATKWEETRKGHLHKGTPYYFRAMAAVASGNIDRGFLFFHQALDEDEKIQGRPAVNTAWRFVTFDYSNKHQAALGLLKPRADWLGNIISTYQTSGRGSLSLATLKNRVLDNPQLTETTFSFTHAVFRSENFMSLPEGFRSSTFASQLALDILFSLCRIAEVWLKDRQPPNNRYERQLGGQLIRFFRDNHFVSQPPYLTDTDLSQIGNADFDQCLDALLDGKQGPLPRPFRPLESDLIIIYILRNQAGHATASSDVVSTRFEDLLERVFFGLFQIVEALF